MCCHLPHWRRTTSWLRRQGNTEAQWDFPCFYAKESKYTICALQKTEQSPSLPKSQPLCFISSYYQQQCEVLSWLSGRSYSMPTQSAVTSEPSQASKLMQIHTMWLLTFSLHLFSYRLINSFCTIKRLEFTLMLAVIKGTGKYRFTEWAYQFIILLKCVPVFKRFTQSS